MRSLTALFALSLLGGCAKDIKPTGPVLTPYERAKDFGSVRYSGAKYAGEAYTSAPVLPFMAFGAAFDLDFAIGLKHDRWDMIEIAKLHNPSSNVPMWIVLESRAGTKEQSVVANVEDINTWMPELPLARKAGGLRVEDRTTSDGFDVTVKYDNIDNEPVEIVIQGAPPEKLAKDRNGNTMGHSASDLLAVLDVSSMESLFKTTVSIDDDDVKMRKVAGIVPMRFALTQTQGGVARGEYWMELTDSEPMSEDGTYDMAYTWEPPPPPPAPPTIPEPANPAGEDVVLLAIDEWTPLSEKDLAKAMEKVETNIDVCLVPAQLKDPEYKGLVAVDFHVKDGKPWEITIDEDSTATELVMQCVQSTITEYTFDEKLDGSIHLELGVFPVDHEPANDMEKAWIEAHPPATPEPEEGEEELPEGEDLPEEGDDEGDDLDDLLGGDELKPEEVAEVMLSEFNTVHKMPDGKEIAQPWDVERRGGRVFVTQDSGTRRVVYEFLVFGESFKELRSIRVENWGQATPAFTMTFNPALPDLSMPFSGRVVSDFVMDVGGQLSHATGTVETTSEDAGAKVKIIPSAPEWAASRPVSSQVQFKDGVPHVLTRIGN